MTIDGVIYGGPTSAGSPNDLLSRQNVTSLRTKLELRVQHNLRKDTRPSLIDHTYCYEPYCIPTNACTRSKFLRLAKLFHFLDRGFAEYLHYVLPFAPERHLNDSFAAARREITKRQVLGSLDKEDPRSVFLGDLGHYCEDAVYIHHQKGSSQSTTYRASYGRDDELLHYIQDSYEVLYWDILLDLFARSRANSTGLVSDLIFRVLDSTRSDIKVVLKQIDLESKQADSTNDIEPLLLGAKARVRVLDSFTDQHISSVEREELIDKLSLSVDTISPRDSANTGAVDSRVAKGTIITAVVPLTQSNHAQLSSLLSGLVVLTTAFTTIPFALGFAASSASTEPGTIADADYWYNISQAIAVIMGNFMAILSLRKQAWLSQEYVITWLFLGMGAACAIASIVVYPLCNTRWSSLLASITTIAGFGATLSMTMAEGSSRPKSLPVAHSDGKVKAQ